MSTKGWEHVTAKDVCARRPSMRPAKYRNIKKMVDGRVFDSTKEAAEYLRLKALEAAGEIADLCCQVPFPLLAPVEGTPGMFAIVSYYVADFTFTELPSGAKVVEDVKGFLTKEYRLKRKWLALQNEIEIREV